MDPSAWIALGALGFLVFVQGATVAFMFGGLFARLRVIETRSAADGDCKAELMVLTSKFEGMEKALQEVKDVLTSSPRRANAAR